MERIYKLMKLNRTINSHRFKYLAIYLAHNLKRRHLCVRMDPVIGCNIRCRMCQFSNSENQIDKSRFENDDFIRIAGMFFPQTFQAYIGCSAEPTLHKNFMSIVELAKRHKVPHVGLVTNGQLLTEDHVKRLIDYELDELTISVHGIRKSTYEYFMQGASYEKLHEVLKMVHVLKEKYSSDLPGLRINYTANKDNMVELKEFFDVFDQYSIKTLQIRPIMDNNGLYSDLLDENILTHYDEVVTSLIRQCATRKINILATRDDLRYEDDNYSSLILPAVLRHITPDRVWKEDFNWRSETYDDYCRRINWKKHLFKCAFLSREAVIARNTDFLRRYAARYEVI